jgi:predicted Zn-dependent peptidase
MRPTTIHLALAGLVLAACGPATPPPYTPVPDPEWKESAEPATPATPPPPADPAPVVDGDVTEAWVNGIQILVKQIPGSQVTSTALFIRGGVRNWTPAEAGLEGLAIRVATTGGTEALDKDAFSKKLSELGSSIGGGSTNDFSVISAWSLTPTWDETFGYLVDTFRRPALPEAQFELVRAQHVQGLKREQEDPDSRLGLMVHDGIFKGHPYEHRAIGRLETVPTFTLDQARAHLAKLREASRLLIVVVGDVDAKRVTDQARTRLGDLPRGAYIDSAMPAWTTAKGEVTIVEDKLPTNYIQAVFPGPSMRDPDYATAMVAMSVLGYRLFEEVRTKRNLSYAPGARFARGEAVTHASLYVTAVDPVATMTVMLGEARRLRDEPVPDKDLAGTKAMLKTSEVSSKEAPSDQAWELGQAQVVGGDWRLVRTLPDRVQSVTAAQIQAWAQEHLTRLRTFVIGDRSKIDPAPLESF